MSAPNVHLYSGVGEARSNPARRADDVTYRLKALLQHVYVDAFSSPTYAYLGQFDDWFEQLISSLNHLRHVRSKALQALDTKRQANPNWFTQSNMLGYSAYVDRFGRDFRGVAQRAGYLRELGVTYLHLLPFLQPREGDNDGGFAVRNFEKVDPRFGTEQDLIDLAAHLRDHGISLCSDLVLNHIADDHAWAVAARAGDQRYQHFFYVLPTQQEVQAYEQHLGQVFPQTAPGNFTHVPAMNGHVWTTFYPYQWDLNWSNPEVFAAMATTLVRLANLGIEVFRLDSVPFLWKQLGTDCMNLPQAHTLVQALRCVTEYACPGVLLKAEAIVPTQHLPAYLGQVAGAPATQECHIAYHSGLMAASWLALAVQNTQVLEQVMQATPSQPQDTTWLTYVRCHDDIIWSSVRPEIQALNLSFNQVMQPVVDWLTGAHPASFARGMASQNADPNVIHGTNGMAASLTGFDVVHTDPDSAQLSVQATARMLLLHALAFSFGGMPVLYAGDELAQPNFAGDQANALIAQDGRWLQRPYFDDALLQQPAHQSMFKQMKQLAAARARHDALAADQPRQLLKWEQQPTSIAVFLRGAAVDGVKPVLCLFNFSEQEHTLHLSDVLQSTSLVGQAQWHDVCSDQTHHASVSLQPWQFMWLTPAAPSCASAQ